MKKLVNTAIRKNKIIIINHYNTIKFYKKVILQNNIKQLQFVYAMDDHKKEYINITPSTRGKLIKKDDH